jgi:hypothetical protein
VGDPWVMPGLFLLDPAGDVVWRHDFEHAGDHPDWNEMTTVATRPAQAA